jgi:peptidoglycan/xylan/chitin deacetylase (PgdA/CDA1 family)
MNVKRPPLVLAYHGVDDSLPWPKALPITMFERQMLELSNLGYVGMTFAEMERRRQNGTLPARPVAVTFDDGYSSNRNAVPVLSRLGWPATVFLQLDFVETGIEHPWTGTSPLSWDEIGEMQKEGWEFGSHTLTHPRLSQVSDKHLEQELAASRIRIGERLGKCETIAYPHGDVDRRVSEAADRAGYLAGAALERFHLVDEPHRRPRIGITQTDVGPKLKRKISHIGMAARRSRLLALGSGTGRAALRRAR